MYITIYTSVLVQSLSYVQLFVISWTAARQASLSFTVSQSLLKLMSLESLTSSNPTSGSFPVSQLFASGGQRIGASASFLPVNTQGWSPSGWTGWVSLQSKGLSRVFSNTTVQKHQFFGAQPSLWSKSHIHT